MNIWVEPSEETKQNFLKLYLEKKSKYPKTKVSLNLTQYLNNYEFFTTNNIPVLINEYLKELDFSNILNILDLFIETSNTKSDISLTE